MIAKILFYLRSLILRQKLDAQMTEEMKFHLEMETEARIAAGMPLDEARDAALREFGNVASVQERTRDEHGWVWLEQFAQDLRYATRLFRRERGFAVTALLILAIGIGLNTTVFSLVNTVLLRQLPFGDADRLVWITNGDPSWSDRQLSGITSSVVTWEGLKKLNHTLDQLEAYYPFSLLQTYRLTEGDESETITSVAVSHGLFGMLKVKPLMGRLFLPEDVVKNAPLRMILTHEIWQRRYNSDPSIIGRSIRINEQSSAEVVGVLPPADAFTSVFFPTTRIDVYSPLNLELIHPTGNTLFLIGHIKAGSTIEEVGADLKLSVAQLKKQYPERGDWYVANSNPLHEWVAGNLKRPLLFLWIAAGMVLAIAGFNLGGLLLVRGVVRRKELALRCALGAKRMRIVRQLLVECLLLVSVGSTLGGLLAWISIQFLSIHSAVEIPMLQMLRLDGSALGFTILLGAFVTVLCGAVPAWRLTRGIELQSPLNAAGQNLSSSRHLVSTRNLLVVLEVALACVLAVAAGLMTRSFTNLLKVDLGFDPHNLIAVRIDPVCEGSHTAYLETVLDRVRTMPGVISAGVTDCLPVERDRSWTIYPVIPDKPAEQHQAGAHVRVVSAGLLAAMGTPLIEGRDFTRSDLPDSPHVIIVNRSIATLFWQGQSALGRQVIISCFDTPFTVIGVAADVRHDGPEVQSGGEMYLPAAVGAPFSADSWDMAIRTTLPAATLTADLHNALREIDATLPLTKLRPVQTLVDRTLSSRHLLLSLIIGFAVIAIGLAALGLYGVISYTVTQQKKEIGIRIALGATETTVQQQIVGQTMKLALWGVTLGVGGALVSGRLLQSLLYDLSANDGLSFGVAVSTVMACAYIAGYIPARRAARTDPMVALRAE